MAKIHTGADVKRQFKPLSEADIQAYSDEASFQKGYDYYLHHAIIEPTLSESVLRAFYHGSSGSLYRVEVTLLPADDKSAHKLVSAGCSCPQAGICKHLVALLLTWLHQPERFVVRSRLMGRLSEKSREELLALLDQLVQRQPDIEPMVELLVELPLAIPAQEKNRPGRGKERTVDPSTIESQVASAFYHAGEGWGAASRVAAELDRLCDIGKSFAEAGEWANAQVVYATIAEETIIQYEGLHDEGQVSWILGVCAAGLVACLNAQSTLPKREQLDAEEREELLTTLFDLWKFGDNYGGIGVDVAGAIAGNATARERKWVEAWVREEMRPGQDSSSTWRNRSVVDFVVKLKQAEHASEEDVLKEYRHAGLYKELAERLLQLGRENEALDVAQAHLTEPMEVTWFAEQLLKLGEAWREQALAFVETRLNELKPALQGKSQDFTSAYTVDTYRRWLSEKYLLYGKAKQALDMELARFQASPDHTTYRSVRSAAQAADQPEEVWSGLRPQLIRTLEQQGRWGALVTIYLDEGEVGQALAALAEMERAPRTSLYGYGYRAEGAPSHYQAQVAEAAEESYPDEAIRLYKSVVQRLIDGRGRENYQQATGYLARIRRLYQKQGREPEWQAYMATLRNSNKSLRALKEELDKRDL
ncbi:MAG: hypothetical protein E6I59_06750 [Chloroflexi bacterium]|nr:MAG: hypothetical protein E6I59_06750 [Chloroflexota bacterium]